MPSNCTYGCLKYHTSKKLSLFKIPKEEHKRKLWEESLGKTLKKSSQVCELHFRKEDILTEKLFTDSSGQILGVGQYQKKMLRGGAVPKPCSLITVNCPSPETEQKTKALEKKEYTRLPQNKKEAPSVSDVKFDSMDAKLHNFTELDDCEITNDIDPHINKYVLY